MDWPPCPFWDHALAVYGRDGVAPACVELQDRHGLDVNLLLLACWLGADGRALNRAALARALDASRRWQAEVVAPLRAARRALKAQLERGAAGEVARAHAGLAAALRRRLAAVELGAEHLEQLGLSAAVAGLPADAALAGPDLAAANLALYHRFTAGDRPALRALLAGAFPEAGAPAIEAALGTAFRGARAEATRGPRA